CGTGVSPVVFTVRNGVSEPLFSLLPRAAMPYRGTATCTGVFVLGEVPKHNCAWCEIPISHPLGQDSSPGTFACNGSRRRRRKKGFSRQQAELRAGVSEHFFGQAAHGSPRASHGRHYRAGCPHRGECQTKSCNWLADTPPGTGSDADRGSDSSSRSGYQAMLSSRGG
ncbi:MAG: hypothetical protein JXQ75_11300, partial [Phycisphaerae bacterium]|nr:hypothetical protein [Phycisphaerae bacterium]